MTNRRKGDSMTAIPRSLAAVLVALALLTGAIAASTPAAVAAPASPYITDFSARTLDEAGNDDTVAGGHPFEAVTSFLLPAAGNAGQSVKSVFTELPAGFVANVGVAARCTIAQLRPPSDPNNPVCPAASRLGTVELLEASTGEAPGGPIALYNMVPERGYPAELGFNTGSKAVVLYAQLRARTGQYGVTVASPGIAIQANITGVKLSLYGVPSQGNGAGGAPMPFMTDPSNCQEAEPSTKLFADSWEFPGRLLQAGSSDFGEPDPSDPTWRTATAPAPPVTGCDSPSLASQFAPTIDSHPSAEAGSSRADAPSGYTVDLDFPQTNDPTDSSSTVDPSIPGAPPLKSATVTLPAGVAISPSAADGLEGCSDQASDPAGDQVHYDTTNPATCPEGSKIGTIVATSPLLAQRDPETDEVIGADPVGGEVFVLKPHPGDLAQGQDGTFRVLIDVTSEKYGINVKLPGTVTANKTTGQLTASFLENPQLPVKHLEIKLKPGPRAPLANPSTCGTFTTTTDLVPWSTPGTPDAHPSASFGITEGAGGAPCVSSPDARAFAPSMSAGTTQTQAGAASPFTLDISRSDAEQELHNISVSMPKGFTAKLTGIPYCSDAAITQATGKTGAAEQASPSCPAASQVGSVTTAAGPGSNPYYVSGKAYLAGPYKGGSLSLVFITPAVAGPFDLGNVLIRAAAYIDPTTAQVSVKSDDIPQMLDGVRLQIRHVSVAINREGFVLNPTNCEAKTINAGIAGGSAGQATANVSSSFAVGGCAALKFAPKFSVSTVGQSSKANGASLTTKISYPYAAAGAVNLTKVKVVLPKQLPSRLTTLQKACTSAQFDSNPAGCPSASFIGHATVHTPLLPVPLTGPAIFVSHGGEAFPSVELVLQGDNITVDLVGTTLIKGGVTSTTFKTVPDVPFTDFELVLPQGPYSALGANLPAKANYNFCAQKMVMPTEMIAQNGAAIYQNTKIATTGCKAKPLTRAQKLAAALKACKKKHKAKRAACARTARRHFATTARRTHKQR
jgi:hypothetical protein